MAWFATRLSAAAGLSMVLVVASGCGGGKPSAKDPSSTGSSEGDNKAGPAEVGKNAPELSIQTVNGKGQVTLDSLHGKVAIVDFWATWCGPCKQSFPKLEELAKQNAGKVQVVGISVDDKADGVADFAKSNGATFAIGWDDGHTIANRWKVESMPTTYILDRSGKVRFIHAGYHDGEAETIAKELATLTSEDGSSSKSKSDVAATDTSGASGDAPATPPKGGDTSAVAAPANGSDTASSDAVEPPVATPPKKAAAKKAAKPAGAKKPGAKKAPGKKPKAR